MSSHSIKRANSIFVISLILIGICVIFAILTFIAFILMLLNTFEWQFVCNVLLCSLVILRVCYHHSVWRSKRSLAAVIIAAAVVPAIGIGIYLQVRAHFIFGLRALSYALPGLVFSNLVVILSAVALLLIVIISNKNRIRLIIINKESSIRLRNTAKRLIIAGLALLVVPFVSIGQICLLAAVLLIGIDERNVAKQTIE